jgi:2-succinyl-6-hydroxy-2,4-cyclohexadiene-1-carboxylate synthase
MAAMRRVFVPGFTQSARSWDAVWAQLPGDTVDELVDVPDGLDFVATATALGERHGRATWVGYSLGGRLCLQLALDRPGMVERLVLVSASPGIADEEARAERRAADGILADQVERDGVATFVDRWLAQPMFASLPAEAAQRDQRVEANTAPRLAHQLRALGQGTQPSNWERLARLSVPVLLIVGERDTKYVDIASQMAARLPDARLEVVPGAGHACHLEEAGAVAELITSW